MASLAGARRTDTALARLKGQTRAPGAIVFATQSGVAKPDFDALRARPEVADLAVWDLVFGNINNEGPGLLFASDDGRWGRTVARPVVIKGRMWDPNASDEMVVDENQEKQGAVIGSTLRLAMSGPTLQDFGKGNGPTATLRVVGVVREVRQFVFVTEGQAFVGPGFVQRYRASGSIFPNADVVLRDTSRASITKLRRDVNDIVGPGTPVLDLHAVERRVNTTLSVEHVALLLIAAAITIAGGLLVGQALLRSAAVIGDDALVLRSIGMSRPQLAAAAGLSHVATASIAAAVAFTTAALASRLFPVGLGRRIDPGVGTHVDWVVVLPGLVLTVGLILGATLVVAWRAASLHERGAGHRPPSFMATVRRAAPLPVNLGMGLAFERGNGRTSTPVVPALVGAIVGVLGVIGALTIEHALNDALAHPERAGVTWELTARPPDIGTSTGIDPSFLAATRRGAGDNIAVVERDLVQIGGVGVPTFAIRTEANSTAPIAFRVIKGRRPRTDREVAIGPLTADNLGVRIGSTLRAGDGHVPLVVVGEALFPSDVHAEFDEGAWLTPVQFDHVVGADPREASVAIKLKTRKDAPTVTSTLRRELPPGSDVTPAPVPVELTNLRNVRTLPLLLAGFLALLAVAAVGHVLVTSSRRRRHDFAILRALGLDRRRTRLVLNAQGSAVGMAGLVVGLPLGLALARSVWELVTTRVPLANVAPFTLLAVVLIVPITALIVNALALWPARHVVRLPPAEVLRTE